MIIMAPQNNKTKRHAKNKGQFRGCKKQQSSMPKPGILPARIPEITKSSHPRHDIHPDIEANTDNAGSQQKW